MRYTLLQLTQLILSSMDSDDVATIDETVESVQVTTLLQNVFYDLATELDLPEHETLFELTASGVNDEPCLMTIPTNVTKLSWVKYDNKDANTTYTDWREVKFLPLQDFISRQNSLRGNADVMVTVGSTFASDILTATAHPFSDGDTVRLNTSGTDLPDPLAIKTSYFVVSKTADNFKLSLTSGGAAITLTDDGTGTHEAFTFQANTFSMDVTVNGEVHEFIYKDDKHPEFYTTMDDETLIFDSYDVAIDTTTLAAAKTMCHGAVYPVFTISDSFAPDLDPTQFAYFIQKAKVRAHFEMRQLSHPEASAEARRQLIGIQKKQRKTENLTGLQQVQRYGRTRP